MTHNEDSTRVSPLRVKWYIVSQISININDHFIAPRQATFCSRFRHWWTVPWASQANSPVPGDPLQPLVSLSRTPGTWHNDCGVLHLSSAGAQTPWGWRCSVLPATVASPYLWLAVPHSVKTWCLDAFEDFELYRKPFNWLLNWFLRRSGCSKGRFLKLWKENLKISSWSQRLQKQPESWW